MKRTIIVCGLLMVAATLYSKPIKKDIHYDVKLVSDKNLYSLIGRGKLNDSSLLEYTINDNIYIAMIDNGYYSSNLSDSELNLITGRFYFSVFTKSEKIDYEIKKIVICNESKVMDLYTTIYQYYPYEKPVKTDFKEYDVNNNYRVSYYYVGYFKIPAKDKENIKFIITIQKDDEEYCFTYRYKVEKKKNFFFWLQ